MSGETCLQVSQPPQISKREPRIFEALTCQVPEAGSHCPLSVGANGAAAQGMLVLMKPRESTTGELLPLTGASIAAFVWALVAQVRVRSVDANLGYLSLHTASRRASIFSCHTAFAAFSSPDSHTS